MCEYFTMLSSVLMGSPCVDIEALIHLLALESHPEGGYYRQTYASSTYTISDCTVGIKKARGASSVIIYLLPRNQVSKFHRIDADEVWCFHAGASLVIAALDPVFGACVQTTLGNDFKNGHVLQHVVSRGTWFAAFVLNNSVELFSLAGCTVSPAFLFEGFELADRDHLLKMFPAEADIITRLT